MKISSILQSLIIILFLTHCTNEKMGNNINFDLSKIQLSWKVITNFHDGKSQHVSSFTLTNNSDDTLDSNWKLFWNQSPRNVIEVIHPDLNIRKINGDFYEMDPAAHFKLFPGAMTEVKYVADAWLIKECDGPLGLYFIQNDQKIPVTNYRLEPFITEEQTARSHLEKTPQYTALSQFQENEKLNFIDDELSRAILPVPTAYVSKPGQFQLNQNSSITYDENLKDETDQLISLIEEAIKFKIKSVQTESDLGDIHLKIDRTLDAEHYSLTIEESGVEITGGDAAGVFYGVQSLINLIPIEVYEGSQGLTFPALTITDGPKYNYRGIHLDVSRHFFQKSTVKKLIDVMARYKANQLLFYFTEDEGWRLEIKDIPELTEVGSRRGHNLDGLEMLQHSYGSGADFEGAENNGTGYYTRADYIDILQYANARHVKVIPQVNFPGHARAAVKAMEARYHKYKDSDPKKASQYRLADPNDQSIYQSAQHYTDNIVCVCQESPFELYEAVIDDIISMHKEAGVPLEIFHTGGDEVPRGAWEKSPICQEFLKSHPEVGSAMNLQRYFTERAVKIIKSKGLLTGGWEEVAMNIQPDGWTPNENLGDGNVIAYIWNNVWGNQELGYKLANAGYPIVLCNVTNLYFDLAYNNDPREPGLYWGGWCNARLAYEFIPGNLYKSTLKDALGNDFVPEKDFHGYVELTTEGRNNILGIQAQLWSETIQDEAMLEYYYLPKLFGFAERAWNGDPNWSSNNNTEKRNLAADKEWSKLAQIIGSRDIHRLDFMNGGYNYRIPTPGIRQDGNLVSMNGSYPGFEIRYTLDGSDPSENSPVYTKPFETDSKYVVAKMFNRKGRSGLSAKSVSGIAD